MSDTKVRVTPLEHRAKWAQVRTEYDPPAPPSEAADVAANTPRPLRSYTVMTPKFGEVTIEAFDIADARRDARKRFGVKNPALVRAVTTYALCAECDSKPCCCKEPA